MKVSSFTVWSEHTYRVLKGRLALADYVECLHSERLASNPEVDAPIQLDANRTTQAPKSDGSRPGVLVRFPPLRFGTAIQRLLYNEQTKYSKNLDNINKALQAQIACQLNGYPSFSVHCIQGGTCSGKSL